MPFVTEEQMEAKLAEIEAWEEEIIRKNPDCNHGNKGFWDDLSVGVIAEDEEGNITLPNWWTLETAIRNLDLCLRLGNPSSPAKTLQKGTFNWRLYLKIQKEAPEADVLGMLKEYTKEQNKQNEERRKLKLQKKT